MNVMAATDILARSTTLTSLGWLGYIIIGALAGCVAGMIMKTKEGLLLDIVIGVAGALIGGFLLSFVVDTASGGWWFTVFTAILGTGMDSGESRQGRNPYCATVQLQDSAQEFLNAGTGPITCNAFTPNQPRAP